MDEQLFLRFIGTENLEPVAWRGKELATVVTNFEEVIAATVCARSPEIKTNQVKVSLVEIRSSSVGLAFTPNLPALTIPAATQVVDAFERGDFRDIPYAAVVKLRELIKFIRQRDYEARLSVGGKEGSVSTTITAETRIEMPGLAVGETILYGRVIRVGGIEPKVLLKTIDDETLYCPTTESIVRQLGDRIYEEVGVYGMAQWDLNTWKVEEFEITQVLPYKKTSATEAFNALRDAVDGHFDDVEDVEAFVQNMRR